MTCYFPFFGDVCFRPSSLDKGYDPDSLSSDPLSSLTFLQNPFNLFHFHSWWLWNEDILRPFRSCRLIHKLYQILNLVTSTKDQFSTCTIFLHKKVIECKRCTTDTICYRKMYKKSLSESLMSLANKLLILSEYITATSNKIIIHTYCNLSWKCEREKRLIPIHHVVDSHFSWFVVCCIWILPNCKVKHTSTSKSLLRSLLNIIIV